MVSSESFANILSFVRDDKYDNLERKHVRLFLSCILRSHKDIFFVAKYHAKVTKRIQYPPPETFENILLLQSIENSSSVEGLSLPEERRVTEQMTRESDFGLILISLCGHQLPL